VKITTHTSPAVAPAVGWGQTFGLTAYPAHQKKSFSGDNTGKAPCSLVLLHLWQTPGLTQLKPKAAPD